MAADLAALKEFLLDPKLKIPAGCTEIIGWLVSLLTEKGMEPHKEEIIDALKLIIVSPPNLQVVAETIKHDSLVSKLLEISLAEKSRSLIKKEFKLLGLMLNQKALRDTILGKPLADVTELVKGHCKKGTCEAQWEGLYVFIRELAKSWPPIPFEKV